MFTSNGSCAVVNFTVVSTKIFQHLKCKAMIHLSANNYLVSGMIKQITMQIQIIITQQVQAGKHLTQFNPDSMKVYWLMRGVMMLHSNTLNKRLNLKTLILAQMNNLKVRFFLLRSARGLKSRNSSASYVHGGKIRTMDVVKLAQNNWCWDWTVMTSVCVLTAGRVLKKQVKQIVSVNVGRYTIWCSNAI